MSISFSGLASGLDTSSWVESLVALKKAKVSSLEEEKKEVQSLQETLSKIKSFFSSFRSMLEKVTDAKFGVASMDLFAQNLATSSNLEALTASATTEAEEATYNVFVDKLASETKANSTYTYMTTIIQTTTANGDSKLINLGVKAGNIGVVVNGVEHGINITENDTISSFIEKLGKVGVKASYNENSGVFNIDISKNDIKDTDKTEIVDKLHLQGVNEGYTSNNLQTSHVDTIYSAANESTKLSVFGVQEGTITVHSNDKDYSITIGKDDTIGDLIKNLKNNNIESSIDSEGLFTITNASITNEGTTKILDSLGLTSEVYEKGQVTGNLSHNSIVVSTTTATRDTLLKDLGTGTAISDNQTVIVKNSNNELKTITVGTTTTVGELLDEFTKAGFYAALNSDGRVEIAGGTIQGGTFDAVKALGLEKEPFTAIVTGKELTETVEVHKIVDLQTKLVDDLKVTEGYLEVTDANNAKHYEKIYSGQTIADFMADMGNLGINTSLDEDTGVLTITGGSFKTLSDADVQALVANGTIRENDARYQKGTNLLTCLYGSAAINANQTSVASSSAKSKALRHTVTNTYYASRDSKLSDLGIGNTSYVVHNSLGQATTTVSVSSGTTIGTFLDGLKAYQIDGIISEGIIKLHCDNGQYITGDLATQLGIGTQTVTDIVNTTVYSTSAVQYTASGKADLDTRLGSILAINTSNNTMIVYNSLNTAKTTITVDATTTVDQWFAMLANQGIQAEVNQGVFTFISKEGNYVSGSIIDSFGMTPTTVTTTKTTGTSATSGRLYYTQTITATTDTTLSSLGYNSNYTISVMKPNGGTIKEEATITLNSSTTIDQLFDRLDDYGVQGIIADGIITFTSATGAYVQDKSGGLLSGMGISAITYVQTIFVTSTIQQTITTSFETTNTQPVQYTTTSWQTTVTIPADTVTVTVNTSGTVPGREVVVTITQEATSPAIVTYISQTTSSAPVTVNFSTTIPSQTVTHSYTTVVTQNFSVTQTVSTSQTIVGQTTSVSTTTTTTNKELLVNFEGVNIQVGDILNINSGSESANFTVTANSTLNELQHFINAHANAMIILEPGATGRKAIQVKKKDKNVTIGGSLAERLVLSCNLTDPGVYQISQWFTPKKTIVTQTITTTSTIDTTQTITGTTTITISESKSTTITDSFSTVIGARTVTYSTTVPAQNLTTGGWYTFYPKKTSVTGVFTISTSSVTVDSSGTAVVKTPAHTVTIKGTSTVTIPSTTTTVAGTVTVTVNTTTTATVTQTYGLNSNSQRKTYYVTRNADDTTTLSACSGTGTISGVYQERSFTVNASAEKSIGEVLTELAGYGISGSISSGTVTLKGTGDGYITSISGAFGINGSNYYTTATTTIKTNKTSNEKTYTSNNVTLTTATKISSINGYSGGNGSLIIHKTDGTYATISVDASKTLGELFTQLANYGLVGRVDDSGKVSIEGIGNVYLQAATGGSNILTALKLSNVVSNVKTVTVNRTSPLLQYTKTGNSIITGSTKISDLNDTDGRNLGITTGSFYVYNSGVRTTETVTADMTVNDLMSVLAKYGLIADIDENGSISVGAYNNTYLATSAFASQNSNIVSTLFAKWDFVNIYKSNHLDIPVDEIRAINKDTKLSDINEGTYKAGIITVVKDGVQTNISLTSDDTVGTLMDELALYGFESTINDKGQLMIKNTGDSVLKNYSDTTKASNALTLLGIDVNNWIKTNTYESGPLSVTKANTVLTAAQRDTLLSNLGVTTGEYYIFNNGVKYTAMISSDETIGSFMDTLKSFGIETSLVQGVNGSVLSIVGKGDSYIKKSTSTTNSSNVVEQLFKTNKTAYEYKGLEQTSTLKTTFTAATEETLVSYFDKNASNNSEGDLTVIVNGQKNTLKITADETIGTLLQKFRDLGLEATVSNGQIMVQSGYDTMTISATGTTSKLLDNINFEYKKDLGGYSASNNTVKSTTTSIEERTLSVASYADLNTKMGQLNISDGSLTVYRNGQKANIEVKANETFGNLRTRLSTAFSDLDLTFENGYLKIYSTNNNNVEIGSTTDTSNFCAITGIESDGSGIAKSSRELYCVNGDSVLTTSGIFRRDNVKTGTFTVGNAVFNITSTTTLSDIINQINASDAANAFAFWDNVEGKLVIKSRSTGAALVNIEAGTSNFTDILGFTKSEWNTDGSIKTTKMDIDTQNIGDNAKIKINGTTYTSTSNTIGSDVTRIKGLTINLKGLTKDSEVTLKVERDKESLANAVSSVVDSYNELMKNVDEAIATDGDLKNESTLKLIRNQLRNLMTSSDMGTTVFRNLDSIGIGFNSASGNNLSTANSAIISLTFDKDKFFKAFDADQDAVKALIIGSANNKGVFTKVEDLVESTLKSVSGYFEATETSYSNKIRDLDKKITKANKEVDRYKARLEAKFQSMDMLIAQMQQQYSSFLTT